MPHAFWTEAASLSLAAGPSDKEGFADLSARYGLDMDFDSAPRLVAEHALESPAEAELAG